MGIVYSTKKYTPIKDNTINYSSESIENGMCAVKISVPFKPEYDQVSSTFKWYRNAVK
jgi:hypothetical protein